MSTSVRIKLDLSRLCASHFKYVRISLNMLRVSWQNDLSDIFIKIELSRVARDKKWTKNTFSWILSNLTSFSEVKKGLVYFYNHHSYFLLKKKITWLQIIFLAWFVCSLISSGKGVKSEFSEVKSECVF